MKSTDGLKMENKKAPHHHSTEQASESTHSKSTYFNAEKQRFLSFLERNTATTTMASRLTGIPQKNLCRYKKMLFDDGLIVELFKTKCRITGRVAAYLTANPEFMAKIKHRNNVRNCQSNKTEN